MAGTGRGRTQGQVVVVRPGMAPRSSCMCSYRGQEELQLCSSF